MGFFSGSGSSVISAVSSLLGGLMGGKSRRKAATTQFHRQKALMDYQNNINQRNELTSPSRQMAGMKAAGMNTAAAFGNGTPQAATVSGGAAGQADMSGVGEGISQAGQRAVQAKQTEQMIQQSQANIELTKAQTDLAKTRAENAAKFESKEREMGLQKLQAEVNLTTERFKYQKLSNITEEEFSKYAAQRAALTIQQMQKNIALTDSNISLQDVEKQLRDGELSWQDRVIMGNLQEQATRMGLNGALAGQAAANTLVLKKTLPFIAEMQQGQIDKLGREVSLLTAQADKVETEGDRERVLAAIDRISLKYADKEHQQELREQLSRIVLNYANSVESGTRSAKNVSDTAQSWLYFWK